MVVNNSTMTSDCLTLINISFGQKNNNKTKQYNENKIETNFPVYDTINIILHRKFQPFSIMQTHKRTKV